MSIFCISSFKASKSSSLRAKKAGLIEKEGNSSFSDFWSSISKYLIDSTSSSNKETLKPLLTPKGQISIISPLIETSPSLVTISTK